LLVGFDDRGKKRRVRGEIRGEGKGEGTEGDERLFFQAPSQFLETVFFVELTGAN
jgi:hypothetical protein